MSAANALLYAFNRGLISPLALTRTDLKVQALSAQVQTNFPPRELGSMMLRPGLGRVDGIFNNQRAVHLQFLKSLQDTAIIELTDHQMRVRINEQILTRVAVATAITNGNFAGNINGWTNHDDAGATSSYVAPYMSLIGTTGGARAIESQDVTVAGGDIGKEHALRIVVAQGYLAVRVGTTFGDDSYISDTTLAPGVHSLAFTPTGNFTVEVSANQAYSTLLTSVNIEAAGAMTVPAPWALADLLKLRGDQSEDIIYVACKGYSQYEIQRRGNGASFGHSWSIVNYLADDGPFNIININDSLLLASSSLTGNTVLSSTIPFFKPGHVGCLFQLTSSQQDTSDVIAGLNQATDFIEVTDVGGNRTFAFQIGGTWTGTIHLERSVGTPGTWVTVATYTSNQNTTFNDGLDNQIIYYRFNFGNDYVSGSAQINMQYSGGGITGIARVTGYTDNQHVNAIVLKAFGSTTAVSTWNQGRWSILDGYPTSGVFYEGRLWWFGNNGIDGSVSDAFRSYDSTVVGASAPISRSIGSGPVETICWGLGLQRLLLGAEMQEFSVRSSYLDEPLTTTDFNIKSPSSRGSSQCNALQIDTNGIFVQRGDPDVDGNTSGFRLIEMSYQGAYGIVDYQSTDLSELCPEVVAAGIIKIAVQRKIDTRIHCLLKDGTVALLVYDPVEKIKAWIPIISPGAGGIIEDIIIMPGGVEDKVYYATNRTINGVTVRNLEKWAQEGQCTGLPEARCADSYIMYAGAETKTITGLGALEGQTVVVWGWNTANPFTVNMPDGTVVTVGRDMGTFVVTGGEITGLPANVTNACVGLSYTAQFQSAKLAYAEKEGTAINMVKAVDHLGVVLANTHCQGLKYGPSFAQLDDMPLVEDSAVLDPNTVWGAYDKDTFEFDGKWDTDSRLCLQAQSPRPCNITAAVIGLEMSERT